VLVIAVTAVASVVTPAVMPIALRVQKTAIAIAAIVLAKSLPDDKRPLFISLTLIAWIKQVVTRSLRLPSKVTEFLVVVSLESNLALKRLPLTRTLDPSSA
jgi:hypothetical protein